MNVKPLIDRHGHRHSRAVYDHWRCSVIKSLDIRECTQAELTIPEKTTDRRVEKSS